MVPLLVAAALTTEPGPCADAIPELAAYETLLRSKPYFPMTNDAVPEMKMVFAAASAWGPVYMSARSRIDRLAGMAASRSGCEIERLGCFQRFLAAHGAMLAIQQGGGNSTLTAPSFTAFREKTLRWGMANWLWLIDACEAEVAKLKASKDGPVVYPITAS